MKRSFSLRSLRIFTSVIFSSVLITAIVGYLAVVPQSAATTITVDNTADSVDAAPGDGTCADSLGRCTLRAAVMEANASTGPHTINVPAGTYTLTLGPSDDEFNFDGAEDGFGDLDILNNDLTISGAGAASTIIDGGAIDRVFDVNNFSAFGAAVNVTFQDLTIRNGNAPTSPEGYFQPGGGIQFDGTDNNTGFPTGTLTINNCRITGNTASGTGGGVLAIFGSLNVSGSELSSNRSVHASGGGLLYDGGAASGLRSLQITNSTISGNSAPNATFGNGAGLWAGGNATKTINYDVITNNSAGAKGGGVLNGNGGLTLNFNVIVGNTASGDPTSSGFWNNSGATTIENDWWGCNQGPGFNPCDRASGPAGFGIVHWLTLNHTATPNSIQVNQSTTLQADFFTNNAGSSIAASDLVALNGRTVLFNNPVLGTISGADPQISGGKANATFNAGSTGGNGSADATVDNATVTASITVNQPASVNTNPSDQTVCEGGTATFTASSSGFPTPTVQWQVSSGGPFTDIPGATSTTLTFTATASQNGNQYRAVFTNSSGTATTTAATLTVNTAPTVTTNPSNQTVCEGQTATFTAAANGSPTPTVQWQVSTGGPFSNIPGATSTTLNFTASAAQNGNQYRAVFTNTCSSATTTPATLTVNPSTTATTPGDQTVCQGASASFSTTAGGTGPFHYAWTVDGSSFNGDSSSISVPTGSLSVGNHPVSVTVSGTCGSATKNAMLTVQESTSATTPGDQTVCPGANANFSTTASGTGPFHYAWTVDGSPFNGDSSSISVPTGSLSVGNHPVSVTVSGTCGSVTKNATLTVQENTTTTDPPDVTVCKGVTATFSTTAAGTSPFHYAWTLDGSPFNGDSPSINVPTGSLSSGPHTVAVTVTGTCGSASQNATLTVDNAPPVITLSSSSASMWPPNHGYQTFNVTDFVASATSTCDGDLLNSVVIASVSSDELEDNPGGADGSTLDDIVIAPDCKSVQLRAERDGNLNGRVYTITFRVTDSVGNVTTATVKISVAVNQNGAPAVDNGPGAGYTVTSSCP
jgi:CSLREA domain-containing protein